MTRAGAPFVLAFGAALLVGAALPMLTAASARDHGVLGQTWPVEEPDLLASIESRLDTLQANGGIERMQREMVAKAEHRVRRPERVGGLGSAEKARRWSFDPSIVVENDIRDQKGNLVAAAGTRVNPLAFVQLKQDIVFVDGDDEAQVAWAVDGWTATKAKIVFVSGSPFDRMKERKRRFFFDQRGELVRKFGIERVPAVVRGRGDVLEIEEVVLGKEAKP